MVTAALLAAKPFKVLASTVSGLKGLSGTRDSLVFLHTTDLIPVQHSHAIRNISSSIEKYHPVLIHAGKGQSSPEWKFDASMEIIENTGDLYRIINRGGIKTAVVIARKTGTGVCSKVSELATRLKKEKGCQVVVCLSELGFRNKASYDDLALATGSKDIDIIISTDQENYSRYPVTAKNKINAEVIIHSPSSCNSVFGSIEIGFDEYGNKNRVCFNSK